MTKPEVKQVENSLLKKRMAMMDKEQGEVENQKIVIPDEKTSERAGKGDTSQKVSNSLSTSIAMTQKRKRGRPKQEEEIEQQVQLGFKIPVSLADRIDNYFEFPLPGIDTKVSLIMVSISRFLDETEKLREEMNKSMARSFPGLK